MMISPEGYYEEYLKGKDAAQIMTAIRGLKKEMGRLKNTMEHPDYNTKVAMCPNEDTQLWCTRLYLERAKEALTAAGGKYTPSQSDLKADAFDASISAISKLTLSIGGFFGGHEIRTVTVADGAVKLLKGHRFYPDEMIEVPQDIWPLETEDFLTGVRELHIGEWRRRYDLRRFGYIVLDGTQWELTIEFSDGQKKVTINGDNAYPYNFHKLRELLGMLPYDEEEIFDDEDED